LSLFVAFYCSTAPWDLPEKRCGKRIERGLLMGAGVRDISINKNDRIVGEIMMRLSKKALQMHIGCDNI
jgi:hypothetical protein